MNSAVLLAILWQCHSGILLPGAGMTDKQDEAAVEAIIANAVHDAGSDRPWTFDRSDYSGDLSELPIGVFDSGIGGLTVLEAILSLDVHNNVSRAPGSDGLPDFQNERFIYLGDQANMPYGNYASAGKVPFLRELILKDATFLLGRRYWPSVEAKRPASDKPPVKAIVIACNTATAYGLDDVRHAIQSWGVPVFVVGVVEAGARGVLEHRRKSGSENSVAILATVGTCSSNAYPRSIERALGLAGQRTPRIVQKGFVELAGAIEGDAAFSGSSSVEDYIRRDIRSLLDGFAGSEASPPIDSVVLGCTHFPLVKDQLISAFAELRQEEINGKFPYRELVAEQIAIIDPAELTARELYRELASRRLQARVPSGDEKNRPQNRFYISVANPQCPQAQIAADGGLTTAYKYGRTASRLDVEDTVVVPMVADKLPASGLKLIQTKLPHVWKSMQ
ncbi:MAG: aspartate/glutamate racemase family protein [Planctomycetaceae bacterium]|nr:aspartate/glutamate racemase family protein [Planctomycetaceae bacterium]